MAKSAKRAASRAQYPPSANLKTTAGAAEEDATQENAALEAVEKSTPKEKKITPNLNSILKLLASFLGLLNRVPEPGN